MHSSFFLFIILRRKKGLAGREGALPRCARDMAGRTQFDSSTLRGSKQLSQYAHATLGSGDLGSAVRLPEGEDLSEWLAVHVVDFYNESTLLYGLVEAADTAERFPTMNAGPKCVAPTASAARACARAAPVHSPSASNARRGGPLTRDHDCCPRLSRPAR